MPRILADCPWLPVRADLFKRRDDQMIASDTRNTTEPIIPSPLRQGLPTGIRPPWHHARLLRIQFRLALSIMTAPLSSARLWNVSALAVLGPHAPSHSAAVQGQLRVETGDWWGPGLGSHEEKISTPQCPAAAGSPRLVWETWWESWLAGCGSPGAQMM